MAVGFLSAVFIPIEIPLANNIRFLFFHHYLNFLSALVLVKRIEISPGIRSENVIISPVSMDEILTI